MSYTPNEENLSEFIAAWGSSSQAMNERISGDETTTNFIFELDQINSDQATLSSNVISTNSAPALFMGDVRTNASDENNSFNNYAIELQGNQLLTSRAPQDQRQSVIDDLCYSVSDSAVLKMTIVYRSNGDTIAPFVRVLGVLVEQ
tara:strand:+ start:109 stop:546 length:438 start_codon:yes stop_codon:yes gene_type:complete